MLRARFRRWLCVVRSASRRTAAVHRSRGHRGPSRVAHAGCCHLVPRRLHPDGRGDSRAARQHHPGERRGGFPASRQAQCHAWLWRMVDLDDAAAAAADEARAQATTAGELWRGGATVDLWAAVTLRVAAAAAVAAGIDARFHTSDKTPGEADVARELVRLAPRPLRHGVRHVGESKDSTPAAALMERALRLHLLHDGMRHPQKLRSNAMLPPTSSLRRRALRTRRRDCPRLLLQDGTRGSAGSGAAARRRSCRACCVSSPRSTVRPAMRPMTWPAARSSGQ